MDIRDFIQAVSGAVVLRPDNILVASALANGAFTSGYFENSPSGDPVVGALSIAHVFLLTAGLGLLLGVGLTSSVAIGFFVVIGVAGGLFAIGSVLEALGPQFYAAAAGAQEAIASLVAEPYLADAYLVFPLVIFAVGGYRWDHTTKVRRRRAVQATHLSMRQYCTYCGSRYKTDASKCAKCGKKVDTASGGFCTDCGKPLSRKAEFCGYCGAEILRGEEVTCQACGTAASPSAKYCNKCGARIRPVSPPEGGVPSETGDKPDGDGRI